MANQKSENKGSVKLDPKTMAATEEGLKAADNGRRWTMDEAVEFARKRRDKWKNIPII